MRSNWQWRSMAKRCVDCRWAFSVFAEQEDRVRCKACESRANAKVLGEWRQIGTFLSNDIPAHRGRLAPVSGCRCESCLVTSATMRLSGADEATAVQRTAELPRGQSAGGGIAPVESPQFPGGIDDMEF